LVFPGDADPGLIRERRKRWFFSGLLRRLLSRRRLRIIMAIGIIIVLRFPFALAIRFIINIVASWALIFC
jgi:hypothetical protein